MAELSSNRGSNPTGGSNILLNRNGIKRSLLFVMYVEHVNVESNVFAR